jgi:hypothetical protein
VDGRTVARAPIAVASVVPVRSVAATAARGPAVVPQAGADPVAEADVQVAIGENAAKVVAADAPAAIATAVPTAQWRSISKS